MSGSSRIFWIAGCVFALLGVLCGAFGAHGLGPWLEQRHEAALAARRLAVWETGSRYALMHGLGLLAAALACARAEARGVWPRPAQLGGYALLSGTTVFSGTLWLLVLTGQAWLGAITPIGGVLLLLGWAGLAWAARPQPSA